MKIIIVSLFILSYLSIIPGLLILIENQKERAEQMAISLNGGAK